MTVTQYHLHDCENDCECYLCIIRAHIKYNVVNKLPLNTNITDELLNLVTIGYIDQILNEDELGIPGEITLLPTPLMLEYFPKYCITDPE